MLASNSSTRTKEINNRMEQKNGNDDGTDGGFDSGSGRSRSAAHRRSAADALWRAHCGVDDEMWLPPPSAFRLNDVVWRGRTLARSAEATADLSADAVDALRAAIASLRFRTRDDTLLLGEVLGRPLSGGAAGGAAVARRLPPFAELLAAGVRSMRLASGDRARSTAARQRHETALFRTLTCVARRHEIGLRAAWPTLPLYDVEKIALLLVARGKLHRLGVGGEWTRAILLALAPSLVALLDRASASADFGASEPIAWREVVERCCLLPAVRAPALFVFRRCVNPGQRRRRRASTHHRSWRAPFRSSASVSAAVLAYPSSSSFDHPDPLVRFLLRAGRVLSHPLAPRPRPRPRRGAPHGRGGADEHAGCYSARLRDCTDPRNGAHGRDAR